jgi:hypothetical protein
MFLSAASPPLWRGRVTGRPALHQSGHNILLHWQVRYLDLPTEWFLSSLTFVKPKFLADMMLSVEFLDLPDPDPSFSVLIRILSLSS